MDRWRTILLSNIAQTDLRTILTRVNRMASLRRLGYRTMKSRICSKIWNRIFFLQVRISMIKLKRFRNSSVISTMKSELILT